MFQAGGIAQQKGRPGGLKTACRVVGFLPVFQVAGYEFVATATQFAYGFEASRSQSEVVVVKGVCQKFARVVAVKGTGSHSDVLMNRVG